VEEEVPPIGDGDHRPVQHGGWDVDVAIALPDAEVAVLGCGGEAPQMLEGSSCLLDIGRVVGGNVRVCFLLAGPGGIRDEAQPSVGREVWRTEIDELLPRDLGQDDPIRCGHVVAEFECHLHMFNSWAASVDLTADLVPYPGNALATHDHLLDDIGTSRWSSGTRAAAIPPTGATVLILVETA
jgi:hypothetical protein